MKLTDVLGILKRTNQHVIRTNDVMACLNVKKDTASHMLRRLAENGLVLRIKRGLWIFPDAIDPMLLPEYLTAPLPSYISLQSALYYHGMISQIPVVTYCVSLARTKIHRTPVGIVSVHHLIPSFFFGYEQIGKRKISMATPEKALLDFLYLQPAKSCLFRALPELELPRKFSVSRAKKMIRSIGSRSRKTLVEDCLRKLLADA